MKRKFIILGLAVSVVAGAEVGARYFLGLGTPPLSVAHPTIEYMFAPDQNLYRFGNHQVYNEYGMRSGLMDQVTQPRRVLVFGDSVLNGGTLSDHSNLATTLATDAGIFYGNVSAGSWGPQNMVAWIDEYGLLDASALVILISSHDLYDVPGFAPLDPQTHPIERPFSALTEGIARYVPRYLPRFLASAAPKMSPPDLTDRVSAAGSVADFIDRAEDAGVKLCAIQHKERDEIGIAPTSNSQNIHAIFDARGVPVLDFGVALSAASENPFRDDIHINDYGQELLAEALRACVEIARIPD